MVAIELNQRMQVRENLKKQFEQDVSVLTSMVVNINKDIPGQNLKLTAFKRVLNAINSDTHD